jgi:hypothetical protein
VTVKLDAKAALASFGLRGSKHGWKKKSSFGLQKKKAKMSQKNFFKVDTKVFLFCDWPEEKAQDQRLRTEQSI